MNEPTDIRAYEKYICMECGKVAKSKDLLITDGMMAAPSCPRCASVRLQLYVESQHEHVEIHAPPEGWEHPAEAKARELFDRVSELTGWREAKVRQWFQLQNPMFGNVSPEWMLMNGRGHRLERFIHEAEKEAHWYRLMNEGEPRDDDGNQS